MTSSSTDSALQENNINGSGSLEAKLPGGINLNVKGVWFSLILVLAVTLGIMGMFAYLYTQNIAAQHEAIAAAIEDVNQQHNDMLDELQLMNYLLSLPQDQRPELTPPMIVYKMLERRVAPQSKPKLDSKPKASAPSRSNRQSEE